MQRLLADTPERAVRVRLVARSAQTGMLRCSFSQRVPALACRSSGCPHPRQWCECLGTRPREGFAGSARLSRDTPRWGAATATGPPRSSRQRIDPVGRSLWRSGRTKEGKNGKKFPKRAILLSLLVFSLFFLGSPTWFMMLLDWRVSDGCVGSPMSGEPFSRRCTDALSVDAYVRHPECRSSCNGTQKGGSSQPRLGSRECHESL